MKKVWLNGALIEAKDALLPLEERGSRFGDGVFETIPVVGGSPYLWNYHMKRLAAGLAALRLPGAPDLLSPALQVCSANNLTEGLVRISLSRAGTSEGYLPTAYPAPAAVTLIIETLPLRPPAAQPLTLWLSSYARISAHALPTHCKLSQGVNSMLARMEAGDHACDEALQLSEAGHLCEASAANLFWLRDGILHTPSLACGALAGVTRQRMLELSPYPVREDVYPLAELQHAEAVFLTSAARGIMPIRSLQPQGWTWQSTRLTAEFSALRERDIKAESRPIQAP
jgi:branched-chain amino acid aminotransferase